ncbi:MAG: ChaB family protein [Candidatus Aenigmarchaeota archaeon]|nr:ChaB family protein [Candidatus Aenigmarchaeota archaeon]
MPYRTNKGLPKQVRNNLPSHAQTIYRKAFNNAAKQYKDPKKRRTSGSLDAIASKVAWSAVKQEYKKSGEGWVRKYSVQKMRS